MTSIIKKWYGRTGNNIIQIINCIHYSFFIKKCKNIILPKHELLSSREIKSLEFFEETRKKITDKDHFFYAKKLGFVLSPKQMRDITQKYIVPILNLKLDLKDTEDNVSIHLRGGDIMRTHPSFIQPPWLYYKTILDNNNFKSIHVVHEDNLNSCIDEFRKLPKTSFQSTTIKNDLEKLCMAENLIMSFSTFSLFVFFVSKNIKRLFVPKYMIDEWYPDLDWGIKIDVIELNGYDMKLWRNKNLNEKRKLLLEFN